LISESVLNEGSYSIVDVADGVIELLEGLVPTGLEFLVENIFVERLKLGNLTVNLFLLGFNGSGITCDSFELRTEDSKELLADNMSLL
jgi:hypothetical protein